MVTVHSVWTNVIFSKATFRWQFTLGGGQVVLNLSVKYPPKCCVLTMSGKCPLVDCVGLNETLKIMVGKSWKKYIVQLTFPQPFFSEFPFSLMHFTSGQYYLPVLR